MTYIWRGRFCALSIGGRFALLRGDLLGLHQWDTEPFSPCSPLCGFFVLRGLHRISVGGRLLSLLGT